MEFKKSNLLIISSLLIVISLILSNGCKKSEPESGNASGNMSNMEDMPTEPVVADNGQSTCPVMEGNPINLDVFVEYKGKKVYFCCADCKEEFLKNPENYISKLPQFNEQEN